MNQEDLNYMINSESWIYDAEREEGLSVEISDWVDRSAGVRLQQTTQLFGSAQEYKQMMMRYTCAMKTVRTRFDILNTEFNSRLQRNPIKNITTRLKRTSSLLDKMASLHLSPTLENVENNIFDIAGVRVICSYIDDIYDIAEALLRQDDIKLIQKKDYITYPKPNGYRSLHLIVSVPVYFSKQKKETRVEVQIRTIAMDFWASLEHQLKYKQSIPNESSIYAQLKSCADLIHSTDEKMLEIRHQLEQSNSAPTSEELLVQTISQLDLPSALMEDRGKKAVPNH
jgi:putative GTP pyrophosphokinase